MDEALQFLFLNLDPRSLKNCRCVCQEWNTFIVKRVWKSASARYKLKNRLYQRWIHGEQVDIIELVTSERRFCFATCDDLNIYCGCLDGYVEVYSLTSGQLVLTLDCMEADERAPMRTEPEFEGFNDNEVQLAVCREVIGTASTQGTVGVWEQGTGDTLYMGKPHGDRSVFGVSVRIGDEEGPQVVTGASDGSIVILRQVEGDWGVTHVLNIGSEVIHIDIEGRWMATAIRQGVYLWDLDLKPPALVESSSQQELSDQCLSVKVWMFTIKYPHVFMVGGRSWQGLQVWNIVENKLIRDLDLNGKRFHNIHSSGKFLAISEFVDYFDDASDAFAFVFDEAELVDTRLSDTSLWRRVRLCTSEDDYSHSLNVCLNTTSILACQSHSVDLQDFWQGPYIQEGTKGGLLDRQKRESGADEISTQDHGSDEDSIHNLPSKNI